MSGEMNGKHAAPPGERDDDGSGPVDVLVDHDPATANVIIRYGHPVECLVMPRLDAVQYATLILKNAGCTNVQFEMIQAATPAAQPKESA